jgi:dTDP-4-amino-4,6-dideoxygalactose transaminase
MIKFFDIYRQDKRIFKKNIKDLSKIIKDGSFVNSKVVEKFEKKFSEFCNVKYVVGCGNGTDAIFLALKSLNLKKNSEVLLPAQTYCSTIFAAISAGLKPVLVDIQKDNPTICPEDLKKKISNKTVAIILVHLYGECCNIKKIKKVIRNRKIILIEDAAQAHGAYDWSYGKKGKKVGSIGNIACFSFYPGKNLGAYGDAGAVTTDNKKLYDKILKLRNLGGIKKYQHDLVGYNSRLDSLQAAILLNKLKELNANNNKRKKIAKHYLKNITNKKIKKLNLSKGCVYHQFVILSKNEKKIIKILKKNKIPYGKHYPKPIHKLAAVRKKYLKKKFINAERFSKYGTSLPMDPNLKKNQLNKICKLLNSI